MSVLECRKNSYLTLYRYLGMNLGLQDTVFLGSTIAAHMKKSESAASDAILQEFVSARRSRALTIIQSTKSTLGNLSPPAPSKLFWWLPIGPGTIRNAIFRIVGKLQIVNNLMAWRFSGLGTRSYG